MKIQIENYDSAWPAKFAEIEEKLTTALNGLDIKIEHIGSTAIPDLAAKPIIDIMVGVNRADDLDKTIEPMIGNDFIYYEAFNSSMPDRRLFVGLKDATDLMEFKQIYTMEDVIPHEELNLRRLCHVHIWKYGSDNWVRHIAFRDYLKEHDEVKERYSNLKKELSTRTWEHGMEYNAAKNDFIKEFEKKAILWHKEKSKQKQP